MRILQFRINGQKLSKDGDFSGLIAGTKGYQIIDCNIEERCLYSKSKSKHRSIGKRIKHPKYANRCVVDCPKPNIRYKHKYCI